MYGWERYSYVQVDVQAVKSCGTFAQNELQ